MRNFDWLSPDDGLDSTCISASSPNLSRWHQIEHISFKVLPFHQNMVEDISIKNRVCMEVNDSVIQCVATQSVVPRPPNCHCLVTC